MSIFDNLKKKNISESTLNLYLKNLKRLNDNNEIKSFNFLKEVNKITDKIERYKPNTRRTYIISIVSLLKQEPKYKKIFSKYYDILLNYNKELKTNNTKSETQNENWITQDQVLEIYNKLKEEANPLLDNKKLTESQYNQVLNWVILSLYVINPPRRNLDYLLMKVVKKYNDDLDRKFNYLDLENKEFVFNNFKTQKTYKKQVVQIDDALMTVINAYLKFHPSCKLIKKKNCNEYFLTNYFGANFESKNAITRVLNKIFDKKIGSSMLRNIYLTSKYADVNQEKNDDMTAMGSSVNTADNNYIKLDGPKKQIIDV
jgi:hypothetical protein